ncbi:hypothetical protein EVB36_007 [Rhizobium phage RHph_TM36]|nr:hypothetical protein EVB36_007 [Rhizobium phage RHph_TM36]QIG67568.1 hypothetical protein EVB43_007 [Rhizobium phage RHph_TM3_3_4B]
MMRDFLNFVERDGALHEEECFLGALIGGAVSLVGGLMGRSDAKKRDAAAAKAAKVPVISNTSHELDLKAMNAAAIAAGYNPMTILNAGGLSAFTKTRTETTGQNAMAAVPTAPSVGSVVAGAASSAFNIWRDDRQAAAQTAALSASSFPPAPRPGNSLMAVLTGTAAGGASGGGGLQIAAVPRLTQKAGAGMPVTPSVEQPTLTNPHPNAAIDRDTRDASAYEERYGDVAGSVAGIWVAYQDALRNVTGYDQKERHKFYANTVNAGWQAVKSAYAGAQGQFAGTGAPTILGGAWDRAKQGLARESNAWFGTGGILGPSTKNGGGGGW